MPAYRVRSFCFVKMFMCLIDCVMLREDPVDYVLVYFEKERMRERFCAFLCIQF